ncbi:MAG: hypothetical protein FWG53_08065 [Clostridiales bacterium]|nr:hypothetical protein [Clostridiales bacterium]
MFGFIKKKEKVNPVWLSELLINMLEKLPDEYSIYLHQLYDGIVGGIMPSSPFDPNYIGIVFNGKVAGKYEKRNDMFFLLKGIKLFNSSSGEFVSVKLYFHDNLLCGLSSSRELNMTDYDINRIRIDNLTRKGAELDKAIADKLKTWGMKELPNPSDVDEVAIGDMEMLRIREIQDGNFLAINNGDFYLIEHSFQEARKIPSKHYKDLQTRVCDLTDEEIYSFSLEATKTIAL